MKCKFILLLILLSSHLVNLKGNAQSYFSTFKYHQAEKWADSILNNLTIEEKIGQLIMIDAFSNQNADQKHIEWIIKKYKIGGIIFFRGYPTSQALLTNRYQSISTTPLFIAMDAEWGLNMRLDSIIGFPKQMTLGAIQNETLTYEMGKAIANQCNRMGVHINFAPVVDININPENPVIHLRSFGEKKELVYDYAKLYMQGLQENGIMAVAKHFPGHGDTDVDSHQDLPELNQNMERLEEVELYPFKKLIKDGVMGVMVAHLHVPAIDSTLSLPTSLSPIAINELLIKELNFKGLVFTDALNMKGVAKNFKAGDAEVMALLAGNDVLVFPQNISKAVGGIMDAIKEGILNEELIQAKARKVLIYKYLLNVPQKTYVNPKNIVQELNNNYSALLNNKLAEASITLVKNTNKTIPISQIYKKNIASISIGIDSANTFQQNLSLYTGVTFYNLPYNSDSTQIAELSSKLKKFNFIIISLHGLSSFSNIKNFGITPQIVEFINAILTDYEGVLVNFGSPYALKFFEKTKVILQANQDEQNYHLAAAEALFGGITISGNLPVSINNKFKAGDGIKIKNTVRLKYSLPEEIGIPSAKLNKIDSVAFAAIKEGATPGCQILIAKDGKVFYQKSFGYMSYDKVLPITNSSIYDLASLTKITATILPIMRFYEMNILKLDDTLGKFLRTPPTYDYGKAHIRDILTHEAGFTAWIPFYENTLNSEKTPDSFFYSLTRNNNHLIQVNDNLFAINSIEDSVLKIIYNTKVKPSGIYNYSDLDFILLKKIVDKIVQIPFDQYLDNTFYKPLGMSSTSFNPLNKFESDRIAPTEIDNYFRYNIIQGYVHDPAAALLGGIAGHAGLFSNANDLAKLGQMFLNNGSYGGEEFFELSTISTFSNRQTSNSRRGLGFDKPEPNPAVTFSPTSRNTPISTFGHTGFTGTCIWIDPTNNLVYIFLSNRTYPDSNNKKLQQLNTRSEIQNIIYTIIQNTK